MTRDEEMYPDAEAFKPERFIKNGALNKEIRDPREFVFGFGRRYVGLNLSTYRLLRPYFSFCITRICPGRFIAFSATWMSVAGILATLEIAKSDETVLPEDRRYFVPGAIVLCVSLNFSSVSLTQKTT
jgi:cytochrome P450